MTRTITRRLATTSAGLALALTVAGCGTDAAAPSASPSSSSLSSSVDPADVQFAQMMIPHHEQAVEMATLALDDRAGASSEVMALAQGIATAQEPEITTMNGWLSEWGAGTDMGMDHDMDGMMSGQEMGDLSDATGTNFDRLWLTMMIEHHEGALSMADAVLTTTNDGRVSDLARAVIQGQKAEIATMTGMLSTP